MAVMLAQVPDFGGGMLVVDLSAFFAGATVQARILWDVAHINSFRFNCNARHSTLHYLQVFNGRVASAFLRPIHSSKAFSLLVTEEQMPARLTPRHTWLCRVEVKML
jgi:hypothetical protein